MSDDVDPGDRKHVEAPNDAGPFDHRCPCDVCRDYREEVTEAVETGSVGGLSDSQYEDARRMVRGLYGSQTRLKTF